MEYLTVQEFAARRSLSERVVWDLVNNNQVEWVNHAVAGSKYRRVRIAANSPVYQPHGSPSGWSPPKSEQPPAVYDPNDFEEVI